MKRFKQYLEEAFRSNDLQKAADLIVKYLSKKLGPLYPDIEPEKWKKSDGSSGVGFRYYNEEGMSIRLNWIGSGPMSNQSSGIASIDVWMNGGNIPDYTIDADGDSIVVVLPAVVKAIMSPKIGNYRVEGIEIKGNYLTEKVADEIAELFSQGMTPKEIIAQGYKIGTVYSIKTKLGIKSVNVSRGSNETKGPSKIMAEIQKVVYDDKKLFDQKMEDLEEIATAIASKSLNSLLITGKAGTGKSFTVEKSLESNGLKEGKDWILVKAGVSAIGAYQILYKWREKIVVFDDADGIFKSEEGRNLLKGALDDKPIRKISWFKESNIVYPFELDVTDPEEAENLRNKKGKVPNMFEFHGSVVFISNLAKSKADPDGAIRSRSMVIDINPSKEALIERMEDLLPKIWPEDMPLKEKKEVFEFVKAGSNSDDITLRKFTKAVKVKKAGMKNWKRIASLYS